MLARDQSSPERTATATVIVNIRRSNFPPVFVNTPYFTGVNVGSAIGSTIYTVTATDGDLLVSITLCIFKKIKLLNTMYVCKLICIHVSICVYEVLFYFCCNGIKYPILLSRVPLLMKLMDICLLLPTLMWKDQQEELSFAMISV